MIVKVSPGPGGQKAVWGLLRGGCSQPWEEKIGLLMLLLVVMAASSHLQRRQRRGRLSGRAWSVVRFSSTHTGEDIQPYPSVGIYQGTPVQAVPSLYQAGAGI